MVLPGGLLRRSEPLRILDYVPVSTTQVIHNGLKLRPVLRLYSTRHRRIAIISTQPSRQIQTTQAVVFIVNRSVSSSLIII